MENKRIKILNKKAIQDGSYLVYWMQSAQRCEYNHALEYAIKQSNKLKQPLVVYFGLTSSFPEANQRHYHFMLEGLKEVRASLEEKGIRFLLEYSDPAEGMIKLAENASLVVVDDGYLRIQRQWRERVASEIEAPLVEVTTNLIVPVEEASRKEEYSAYTIRKKIHQKLGEFMKHLEHNEPKINSLNLELPCGHREVNLDDLQNVINHLNLEKRPGQVKFSHGGLSQAREHLADFITNKLPLYPNLRNDPSQDYLSGLSPYLHFGQISPLEIALRVQESKSIGQEEFLEQLIVRRELSFNFVYYNPFYDQYRVLPEWSRKTLAEHRRDKREYLYSQQELEEARTHDPYWNAAQEEMVLTGKMHGYMRMYWGKKILEWSADPEKAYRRALCLNNKYEIDGRDPNAYAGIAWCFGKHDRAWPERKVFGKVRYMNSQGLKRKFNVEAYIQKVRKLKDEQQQMPD